MLAHTSEINFPGWKNMMEKNQTFVLRFFWIFVVSLSIIACGLQIAERIHYFNTSSTSVAIRFDLNPQFQFPYIAICPQYFSQFGSVKFDYPDRSKLKICDFLNFDNVTLEKLWQDTAHDLNNVTVWSEDGFMMDNQVENTTYNSIYGNCRIMKAKLPINRAVSELGVKIPVRITSDFRHLYTISFHESPILNEYDLLLRENLSNLFNFEFSLVAEKKTALNTKSNPCVASDKFYICRQRCLDCEFNKKLNCSLPFMNNTNKPHCKTSQACNEAMQLIKAILKSHDWRKCSCVKSCSTTTYKSFIASGLFHNDGGYGFRIHFKEFHVQDIVEFESYTPVSLICDIGGILGLFLGFCLLSGLEMLDTFIFGSKMFLNRVQVPKKQAWSLRKPIHYYKPHGAKIWTSPHF